jgi:hypothetical protein
LAAIFSRPRVIAHRDDAVEARRIALEFERAVSGPKQAGRRWLEVSTPTLRYIVAWLGIFAVFNVGLWESPWRTFVNWYLLMALPYATFIFLGYRKIRRSWAMDTDDSTGEGKASDEPDSQRSREAPLVPWPACPLCDRPRTACCPICQTAGANFLPAFTGEEDVDAKRQEGKGFSSFCAQRVVNLSRPGFPRVASGVAIRSPTDTSREH